MSRLIRCYDCQAMIPDLKQHRAICPLSRKAKSKIKLEIKNDDEKEPQKNYKDNTTMFMLLDVSGSMDGLKLNSGKEAIQQCFDSMEEKDRFAICTFDESAFFKLKPRPVGQLKRQKEIPEILNRIFAKGSTALYDAIIMTLSQIKDKENSKNALTILTDGDDNASKYTLAEALKILQDYPKVQVHIIHIDSSGTKNAAYEQLVGKTGSYQVIKKEEEITITLTATFKLAYKSE